MPQFPFIPLKGYINHSPTRQAGITTHVPLCPEGEGQGHRDAPPHRTASRMRVICFTDKATPEGLRRPGETASQTI